jgi:hypothetical protein
MYWNVGIAREFPSSDRSVGAHFGLAMIDVDIRGYGTLDHRKTLLR